MNEFLTNIQDIISWLDKYEIKKYKILPDEHYGYVVNVNNNVKLANKELNFIPVKFNTVLGSFSCAANQLTSLEFCPQKVNMNFYCQYNKLTSLAFCPQEVVYNFDCSNNQLTSLEFCPQIVRGDFNCSDNPNLGDLQLVHNFSKIYQEHLRFKEKKDLANKLEQELDISVKNNKIKI